MTVKMACILVLSAATFCALTAYTPALFCRKAGIKGHIYRVTGNQMPSPDKKPDAPKGTQTRLYIYELTKVSQVVKQGESSFYSAISSRLVKEVESDADGYFKVKLPPGKYSLFTKKDNLFYANTFDGENNIAPVEVVRRKMTEIDIKMDYDAVY